MAFTALYEGEERGAWSVPKDEDAACLNCGEPMYIQSEGKDGTARHFNHYPDRSGCDGGGGGGGGGESPEHIKWKNFAAERLHEIFGDRAAARATVEKTLAAPWSDKEDRDADACVFFENWDNQFGRGLAIEVQHKHKDKDIHAVEMDYNRQGVAVLWLSGEDFHDDGLRMAEVDIRHRTREQTTICELSDKWTKIGPVCGDEPPISHVKDLVFTHELLIGSPDEPGSVPAEIPAEYFDQVSQEIYRSQQWSKLFKDWYSYDTKNVRQPPYKLEEIPQIKIDVAHMLPKRFWKKHWNRGKRKNETVENTYVCSECGAHIARPDHPEPNWKLFCLHVKSEHSSALGRVNTRNGPSRPDQVYSQLLKEKL